MKNISLDWRLRLGMLIPSVNTIAEPQLNAMLPLGVSLHTTRLKLTGSSDAELLAMLDGVEAAAASAAQWSPATRRRCRDADSDRKHRE